MAFLGRISFFSHTNPWQHRQRFHLSPFFIIMNKTCIASSLELFFFCFGELFNTVREKRKHIHCITYSQIGKTNTKVYSFEMKNSSLNIKYDIPIAVSIRSEYVHQGIGSYRNGRRGICFQLRFNENSEKIPYLYSVTLRRMLIIKIRMNFVSAPK